MKFSTSALAALAVCVAAYPQIAEKIARDAKGRTIMPGVEKRQGGGSQSGSQSFPDPQLGFNAKQQYVSTSGEHEYRAPNFAAGDVRGPCPGLNAMANHGYLPRSGVGSHLDFIEGTFQVFGMAADLSGFLTVLGATIDGNGLEWSIGGPTKLLPPLLPVLGTPQGISASHNKYEADVSPCRGDLYKYGNDFTIQIPQFEQLYKLAMAHGNNITLEVMNEFRSQRFDNSVATNPYFWNGPFTGVLVAPAAFEFIFRFMSNKSEEHPQGFLNTEMMMSFMGVQKLSDGSFKFTPGSERIPENWYKRAIGDEYSIPLLNADTVLAAKKYPKFLSVGGNTGKVNTFQGLDFSDISGGVYNSQNLLQGNNLACFAMYAAAQTAPDAVKCSGVFNDVTQVLAGLNKQLTTSIAGLDCPVLAHLDDSQFSKFPGYSKLKCRTGTY